jgi:hypothetical protein
MPAVALSQFVADFASALRGVDSRRPVWTARTTGKSYQAGIGPHPEAEAIRLALSWLVETKASMYASHQLGVPYPNGRRQRCDLRLGDGQDALTVELKLLRLMGDNGKPNDNMLMHILSPYAAHRSALTDCEKLLHAGFEGTQAIVIYGFDYDDWPMDPAIDAFAELASKRVQLGAPAVATFDGLVHPIHTRGRVFGWPLE